MRILLVTPNPSENLNKGFLSCQFPINLGYIASVLLEAGHSVKMADFNVMDIKLFPLILKEFNPEMVGISSMTSGIDNSKKIFASVKNFNPAIKTVLGGVHASALPIETMKDISSLDFLVFGEGEMTLKELAGRLSMGKPVSGVKGLVYRYNERIIKNKIRPLIEDLDSLPYPARQLIPEHLYCRQHVTRGFSRKYMKILELITGRGCPGKCIFCASSVVHKGHLRFRSLRNIIGEIEQYKKSHGLDYVSIEDDTFALNQHLLLGLCDYFKRESLSWGCYGRVDRIDFNILKVMAESGLKKMVFGIESGSQAMLDKMKKGISIEQAKKAVKSAKKAGIRFVECDFLLGAHPDETLETVNDTKKLIFQLMPDFLALSIMCPYPGTEINSLMMKLGQFPENPKWAQFSHFGKLERYNRLTYLTSEQLSSVQKKILKEYYTSPKYVLSQVRQIRSPREARYFFSLGMNYIKEFLLR